jgi:hypothetical protein
MSVTRRLDNKVVASKQVSLPRPEIHSNALNADLRWNPSASNGNSPPIAAHLGGYARYSCVANAAEVGI